jgi:putative PIN family toxin of toxin-antitoxin system
MEEYYEVLNRDKFARFADFKAKADIVLADMHRRAIFFQPQQRVQVIKDPDDNMLLELAEESKAEYLITGNTNDFTISKYHKTAIVSPRDYWEQHRQV